MITKGVTSASESIFKSLASISISPVGIFLFILLPRLLTTPVTAITYSLRTVSALSNTALSTWSSNAICTTPAISLRSMKRRLPRLRYLATKPITVTVLPISLALNSPHLQVLFAPLRKSTIFTSFRNLCTDKIITVLNIYFIYVRFRATRLILSIIGITNIGITNRTCPKNIFQVRSKLLPPVRRSAYP